MLKALYAFIMRDIAFEKTYRFQFVLKTLAIFFQLCIFYFIAKMIDSPGYFSFVLFGLMFSRFFQFWFTAPANSVRQEQHWGTAEYIFLAPYNQVTTILFSISGKAIALIFELSVFFILGRFLFKASFFVNIFAFLPVLLLNSIAFLGLGLISAGFIVRFKRGDPLNWAITSSFDLLSGVYFPIVLMPKFLRNISQTLPTYSSLMLWREILLGNKTPTVVELFVQFLWAAGFALIGFLLLKLAISESKKRGELGLY